MNKVKGRVFDHLLFKRLLSYVKPYRLIFSIALVTVFGLAIFGALRPKILQLAMDSNIELKRSSGFIYYMILMGVFLLLEVICNLFFIYAASWLGQSVVKDIRTKLYEHIIDFKMSYFDHSSVGVLITRTVTDMERIADIFGEGLFMIFSDILKMLVVGGVMFYMNWHLSIVVICTLPIVLIATKIFQRYMKKAFEEVRNEVANLNSFVQERVTGMKIVQLFVREEVEYKKFKEINSRHQKGWLKTVWYNSLFFPIAELLSSIALATVIWWGGLNVVLKDTASVGELTAFIMMVPMMFRPLNQIANKFNTLQMGMVAADRVFKVLDTNSSVQNEGLQKLQQWKGCIKFKEVYFSYIPNELVVKGMSFTANAGQTVAIVGSTGAGKSTIISLLSRFYEINSGQITIDGIDISDFNLRDLRQNMAVVSQDVFLFSDTIYHNITLKNKNITLAQVVAAAKAIGVHDFIESLPQSYAFNVKERGAMLSTGQRQLIAFLRAYVRNPKILILDEATASLDTHSEQLIQEATKAITAGRTSIVIAHRLATVKNANKIIVVESGQIVETGTHNDLLKMSDGYYKKLYESQFLQKYPENY